MSTLIKTREFDYLINNAPIRIDWENALWHKIRYIVIRDLIFQCNSQKLLDVGCGKGIIEYLLPETIFCLGYDIVEEYIKTARLLNESQKNRQFEICDVEKALSGYDNFDTIVITEVLEHLNDDEKILKRMRNLLVDGGILILTVPNHERLTNRLTKVLKQRKFQDESHVREYTIYDIEALLRKCGFKILKVIGIYLQLPKENYLPRIFRFALSFFVDGVAKYLPFIANSILIVAKKC